MTRNLTIMLYASIPLFALAGTMLGADAHANRWSKWPLWAFAILGALLGIPLVVYLLLNAGPMVE